MPVVSETTSTSSAPMPLGLSRTRRGYLSRDSSSSRRCRQRSSPPADPIPRWPEAETSELGTRLDVLCADGSGRPGMDAEPDAWVSPRHSRPHRGKPTQSTGTHLAQMSSMRPGSTRSHCRPGTEAGLRGVGETGSRRGRDSGNRGLHQQLIFEPGREGIYEEGVGRRAWAKRL